MINLWELCTFLVEAKKSTYASWDKAEKILEKDKSTTLSFEKWDWKYHDNYFWWEPYGGREVVFFEWTPIYIMLYYGWVEKNVNDIWDVYKTLQGALLLIPENNPYRWPEKYKNWDYLYSNKFIWEVNNFSGEEKITLNWKEVYRAKYIWWLVDQINENEISY